MDVVERKAYIFVWTSCVIYSFYHVLCTSERHTVRLAYDLTNGTLVARQKDMSDSEWEIWGPTIGFLTLPYGVHFVITYLFRHDRTKKVAAALRLALSFFTIYYMVSFSALLLFIFNALFTLMVSKTRRTWIIWPFHLVLLRVMLSDFVMDDLLGMTYNDYTQYTIFSVSYAWCNMRSVSYCIDVSTGAASSALDLLVYYFYLPLFFMGPVVTFDQFMRRKDAKNLDPKLLDLLSLVRYAFWGLVAELSLHFFYLSAIPLSPKLMRQISTWELCGLGYLMGQFFHLKYLFFYGYCGQFAKLEGVAAPDPPVCIGHIHLYSKMWKYFDRGLHHFLVKYIYIPVVNLHSSVLNRFFASFVCFAFVYFWHGIADFILVWASANFFGVVIEAIAKDFGRTKFYLKYKSRLSDNWHRRLVAFACVPLYALSMMSNFYFFTSLEVGNIYVSRLLLNFNPVPFIPLYLVLYCGTQTGIELDPAKIGKKKN